MKPCGECSLCCKLIDVPGLAGVGKWCPHCKPGTSIGGCQIHDNRPEVCLGFNCFWRAESWPDEFRPDKCKVIFEALPGVKTILVSIDPSRPDAWKEDGVLRAIKILQGKGRPLVLKTVNDSKMFAPEGWTQDMVLAEIKQVMDWKRRIDGDSDIHD